MICLCIEESGLTWLTLTTVGTVISFFLLVWSCIGKQAHYTQTSQTKQRIKR